MDVGFNARLFGVDQVEMFDEEATILVNLKTKRNRFYIAHLYSGGRNGPVCHMFELFANCCGEN